MKSGNASLINWDSHDCKYIGETQSFYWIMPLTWEGGKYCDSDVGGGKATWCIGWEKSDQYWKSYVEDGSSFVMGIYKKINRQVDRQKVYGSDV